VAEQSGDAGYDIRGQREADQVLRQTTTKLKTLISSFTEKFEGNHFKRGFSSLSY
jgi:hypothetical protein